MARLRRYMLGKPGGPSSIPGAHANKGEIQLSKVLHMHTVAYAHTRTTDTTTNKKKSKLIKSENHANLKATFPASGNTKHQTSCNRPCGRMRRCSHPTCARQRQGCIRAPTIHTCHAPSLCCLLDLLLVIPSQFREPVHLNVRLPDGVAHLPEAGEVVPVWDLSVEHGRLEVIKQGLREMLISV